MSTLSAGLWPIADHRGGDTTPTARRDEILADPGFGRHFSDHMVRARWTADGGWHDAELVPYGPLTMDPATNFIHYGQSIFEGLKAYRHSDDSIWTFRPLANAQRFANSARRLAMAELPAELFLASLEALVCARSCFPPRSDSVSVRRMPTNIC